MNRRTFLKTSSFIAAQAAFLSGASFLNAATSNGKQLQVVSNPYSGIDWSKIESHKAALHIHTLQSDGVHCVDQVVNSYRNAGYSIMAITDHDSMKPNKHVAPNGSAKVPAEMASPYPKDPKPNNYPANTTWPWTDYGCSSPANLGMLGLQANEMTNRHHINSYFCDCGWYGDDFDSGREDWNDFELESVKKANGLALLCHPGWSRESHRHPLNWYIERFKKHASDYLLGMEINNNNSSTELYDLGLWDQLLARFMPSRNIWGFGNDDMHNLNVKQTFNCFLIPSLTEENVRNAMLEGKFVACRSTRSVDYRRENFTGLDTFPAIKNIVVDNNKGTISIEAKDCDQIKWISAPESLEVTGDYKTYDSPWQQGKIVHIGSTLNIRAAKGIKNFVRAELHRKEGEHTQRTFLNPFGISG